MLLDVKNVSVRFASGHGVQAVENVSLTVDKKEKVCIVGETGSGKSILLLAIIHLLPENAIVTGEAFFEGEDLIRMKRRQLDKIRGARLSYVPQGSGNGLNPLLTVGFQVAEPMIEHQKVKKKEAIAEAVRLMKRFHIGDEEEVAGQYPFTYSGGMKQRAMIAMGIIAGADMILADEPTKGLDEERIEMVVEAFHSLKDQAVLCVTHDLNFAREISDSISVMYASNQVEYAPAEELLEHPLHPYTQDMIAAMPENGLHFSEGFAMAHEDYAEGGCKYAPRCRFCKEKCKETPPMAEVDGHKVRCWLYAGKEENKHASENRKPV